MNSHPGGSFHLLTVGWSPRIIGSLFDEVSRRTGIAMSHIPFAPAPNVANAPFTIRQPQRTLPRADPHLLASLERPGVPAIRTMIMGDDVVKRLDPERALAYATALAQQFTEAYSRLRPSVVIGGFDGVHSSVGYAVARHLGVQWLSMHFSIIPKGLTGFCDGLLPSSVLPVWSWPPSALHDLASSTLEQFEGRTLNAPAYLSANDLSQVVRRLPGHLGTLLETSRRVLGGGFDDCTEHAPSHMAREYLRKRTNLVRLPGTLLTAPPDGPFVFYGLHRQPESSVDVWAPFASDQRSIVAAIARSTPPTHQVLVKLHKSDADNYSPAQLEEFTRLPGVKLVSPFVQSRTFLDRAAAVFAIHGTLALEAALLRRPAIIFGDSQLIKIPGVVRANRMDDLPDLVRKSLAERPPSRDAVIRGFADYLSHFGPGCYNDWEARLATADLDNLSRLFQALRDRIQAGTLSWRGASMTQPAAVGGPPS